MLSIRRGNFHGVAYSADGRFLVSLNSHTQVPEADLGTFSERLAVKLPEYCHFANFYLRGPRLLAAGSREGQLRLWDTAACKERACLDWQIGAVHGLAFRPDGMTVAAAGHNNALVIWDVDEA